MDKTGDMGQDTGQDRIGHEAREGMTRQDRTGLDMGIGQDKGQDM